MTAVTAKHTVASTAPMRFKSNARAAVHRASSTTRVKTVAELKAEHACGRLFKQVPVAVGAVVVLVDDVIVAAVAVIPGVVVDELEHRSEAVRQSMMV